MRSILISVFLLLAFLLRAQDDERFNLIFSGGIVASQFEGDAYDGSRYHKLGPVLGVYVSRLVSEKVSVNYGMQYVQKGTRRYGTISNPYIYTARLNYIELPLIFSGYYKDKYRLEGGISGAYLFSKYESSTLTGSIKTPWKPYDFCVNIGFGYKLSKRLYTNLRGNFSLLTVRPYQSGVYIGTFWARMFNHGLYNNVLQLTLNYIITPGKKNQDDEY